MEFDEVVRRRRMVRTYESSRPVSRETINRFVDIAICSPSAGFSQGTHFLILDQPAERARFWEATTTERATNAWLDGLQSAPVLIIVLSDKQTYLDRYAEPDKGWVDRSEARWPVPYWDVDAGMAAMLLLLAIVDAELGGCFFGVPAPSWPDVHAAFDIPERVRPVGVISLGYPAPDRRSPSLRRGRRPMAEVRSYGRYGCAEPEPAPASEPPR
jgi:nitroreductase